MDALVLCGGEGSRFAARVEKPLYPIVGRPMVDRVVDALEASDVDQVHAAVSPNAPDTRDHLAESGISLVETPGEGYVSDLAEALSEFDAPVLTVAADLPLLDADLVDEVLGVYRSRRRAADGASARSLAVCVPRALKLALGVSADATFSDDPSLSPTGINAVSNGADERWVSWDVRLAVNVNRRTDVSVAERLTRAD